MTLEEQEQGEQMRRGHDERSMAGSRRGSYGRQYAYFASISAMWNTLSVVCPSPRILLDSPYTILLLLPSVFGPKKGSTAWNDTRTEKGHVVGTKSK
jgi:hypothetical protein